MSRIASLGAGCALVAVLLAGCGGGGEGGARAATTSDPASTTTAGRAASTPAPSGSTVKVRSTRYGPILVDGRGRALYLFTRDRTGPSRCYGDCAGAWPPFYTSGQPRAGTGARASLLGTTRRRGGRLQVTYAGKPLYYYIADRAPGQVTCQNVSEFGGTWLVVRSTGRAVR